MKPSPKIPQNTATLRALGLLAAIVFAVPMMHAQTIVTDTWKNAYNGTYDFTDDVGYLRYSYYVVPTTWGETGPGGDLLPQGGATTSEYYEVLLGDSQVGGPSSAQDQYAVIWGSAQISASTWTDLFIFQLGDLSGPKFQVESLALFAYFHNSNYNIPRLKISLYTSDDISNPTWYSDSANWLEIGSYDGRAYNFNGNQGPVITMTDGLTGGYYLKVAALNDVEITPKSFDVGGVLLTTQAIPEPSSLGLLLLASGAICFHRRKR